MTWVLKLALATTIILSIVAPVQTNYLDNPDLERGIFGNANTLGHFAAATCLLFAHGAACARNLFARNVEVALAIASFAMVWHSEARSSFVAVGVGLALLAYHYRAFFRRRMLIGLAVLMIAGLTTPSLVQDVQKFIIKHNNKNNILTTENILHSQTNLWQAS